MALSGVGGSSTDGTETVQIYQRPGRRSIACPSGCHPVVIGSRCRTGHCCPRTRSPLVAEGSALRHNQDFVLRSYTAVCDKTALIGHKPYRPPPTVGWSGRFICWVMLLPGSVSRVAWPPLDAALLPNLERLLVTRTRSPASHSH